VGVTNAVNLIDGLDGLAAGVSSIAALSLMVLCIMTGSNTAVVLTAALAGACLGFLPRNFNPAEIFMGDTGSTFLGFVLAVTSILGVFKGYALLAVSVSVLCLGLPVFDTVFAMLRRMAKHQPIMQPDRGHLHHRLIDRGFSQKQAVLILYAISFCLGCLAIFISFKDSRIIVVVLLTVILLSFIIYYFNVHVKHKSK
jgi:UDP-GlcNAc:undecaprenyl-phosphate GlcNAc-1-phosphate transferase